MSLINKMLNDLEKRDAFLKENPDKVLDGLYSAYDIELTSKKKSNVFVFYFCLISFSAILAALYLSSDYKYINEVYSSEEIVIDENVDPDASNIKDSDTNLNNEDVAHKPTFFKENTNRYQSLKLDDRIFIKNEAKTKIFEPDKLNLIKSIQFEKDSSGINLIMKMPDEINYLVYNLSNPSRTVIEVESVELGFRLEDLKPVDPIVAIRYSINDEKRFTLVLESEVPLTIRKSLTSTQDDIHDLVVMMEYQWQEKELLPKDDVELTAIVEKQVDIEKESVFKGDIIKTPVTNSPNAYAENLFQQAYVEYKRGNISESLKKLNLSLNQDPGHVKARSTLALILSEKEHFELAYSVLNEGLIQYPENIEWIKMYARLLLDEGKVIEAQSMLSKQKPELALNTEYYALQAAVLQKLSEYEQAAKIYRNLLHVNPHKGIWWMGLGISLESLKRYDDAIYAYQKASNNTSIVKDTRQFILQRINRLSTILKDESS